MKLKPILLFVTALLIARAALASYIPRATVNTATVQTFCGSGSNGAIFGIQCQAPVLILSGLRMPDGGSRATSDGGMPIAPTANSELVSFPGDVYPERLGVNENCIAVVSADAGANVCTFFTWF